MNKLAWIILIFSLPVVSAANPNFSDSTGGSSVPTFEMADSLVPGSVMSLVTKGEHKLPYHVFVPSSYKPDNPLPPIVIAFTLEGTE